MSNFENNQKTVEPSSTYNKEKTLELYRKRKHEAETAKHLAANLEGKIDTQMKAVMEELSKLHPRIIEHYKIDIPSDLSNASAEDIVKLRDKIVEVENTLGLPIQNYLETGNKDYLMSLPDLEDVSSLSEDTTQPVINLQSSSNADDDLLTDI